MTNLNTPKAPGSKTFPFRLGDEVRDKINGLSGVAVSRIYHVTGCDTFLVELPVADGKPGEKINVSGDRLELVAAFPERHIDELPEDTICLGDRVKDHMTGASGRVSLIEVPLFGTTRVCIEPGFNDREKKVGEAWMTDTHFVEVIEPITPKSPDAPAEPVKPKRDGACRLPRNI